MKAESLSSFFKNVKLAMKKHSPEILTGIGIAGMITTAVMAVKATPKALSLIDDEVYDRYVESGSEDTFADWLGVDTDSYTWRDRVNDMPSPLEIVKLTWKCYVPAVTLGGLSIVCLIGANSVNTRRNAALATAYKLSEAALTTYKEKVVEVIGENKEKAVVEAVAKDKIDKNPVSNREVIITDKGNALCYDAVSGRYFKSDIERLRKAVNELNRRMMDEMYISLNDFYYEVGLTATSIGNDLGWNIDAGLIDLDFSTQLADDDTPCIVMDYRVAPRYDFGR